MMTLVRFVFLLLLFETEVKTNLLQTIYLKKQEQTVYDIFIYIIFYIFLDSIVLHFIDFVFKKLKARKTFS